MICVYCVPFFDKVLLPLPQKFILASSHQTLIVLTQFVGLPSMQAAAGSQQ
jgi:hypothetical protein